MKCKVTNLYLFLEEVFIERAEAVVDVILQFLEEGNVGLLALLGLLPNISLTQNKARGRKGDRARGSEILI